MTEATLTVSAPEELLQLFGPRDQHLRILRQLFDVTITHRNGRVRIAGEGDNVNGALRALEKLRHKIQKQGGIAGGDVETAALEEGAQPRDGGKSVKPGASAGASGEDIQIRHAGRRIRPRTRGQARYVDAIREHDLTFATGPAGCGKTFLAVATAVEALKAGQIRKIVLVRPAVEAGESLGFLPGDLRAKLNPYLRPLLDALGEMVDYDRARELMEQETIEVIPLAYMRGRTLNDAFIILDEAQNTTIAQMKMFLTRMGERSKMVVSGDATQLDLPRGVTSGLHDALRRLSRIKAIGVVRLSGEDIVRHALVQRIVEAYDDDDHSVSARQRRGKVRVVAESNPNGEEALDR
ncbi:PhoH family protein [Roseiconus lacunae]|uniref:PhoH-like protein n=1 Tax=Roseiconus lacunae TaxID=2605694 RepID=A0ABT7PCX3_9BACT|nr:PhoH family protein [Roseiconus lacunae]MCD0459629.1 PhoH family protein [Roseiconus lacunae]MDM4014328.1 PhoH family protein [Roseiconus lacunae]WRQ49643.1 PhoH family protein [Stieleria sp. HD01]